MNANQELAESIRCTLFASRDSVPEALDYAITMLARDPAALTALYVVLNTVSNQIMRNQQELVD